MKTQAVKWSGNNRAEILNFCPLARFQYDKNNPLQIQLFLSTNTGRYQVRIGEYIIKENNNFFILSMKE